MAKATKVPKTKEPKNITAPSGIMADWVKPPKVAAPKVAKKKAVTSNKKTISMEDAVAERYLAPLVEKANPHVAAIRVIEAHMAADKDFAEAVRHNLDGMLFTAAKSRLVRRNKANISTIDLEAIVKEIAPNIMRIFENH